MNQDMDADSIREMFTDVDEVEKAKAIESIVLDDAEDSFMGAFEVSDNLPNTDCSANVTNSLYEADESLKSIDEVENGCETGDSKEKTLDSVDFEHTTSFVNKITKQSRLSSPLPSTSSSSSSPPIQFQSQVTTPIMIAKPVERSVIATSSQSNLNKIVYVKLVPRTSVKSVVVSTPTPESQPKAITFTTVKSIYDNPMGKTEPKKLSPIKKAMEEPTTSNTSNSGTIKSAGHTVNLLNNNRILIKSVKNNHSNVNAQSSITTSAKSTNSEGFANSPQIHKDKEKGKDKDKDDIKQQVHEMSNIALHAVNVKPSDETNQPMENEIECATGTNNGRVEKSELEIKKEQVMNENSMEHIVDDITKLSDATDDDSNSLSAPKIKREFEQLQKIVKESKVLSEFLIEQNKRGRRLTKSGKSKHKYNNSMPDMNSLVDDKISMHLNRSVSPSSSSVRSASKESDRSVTSSFNRSTGKRNTRSMNTDFSAKQKKFLKGIQQFTRGTDDETDNNSGVDDDDDDLDYYAKEQPNIVERRKSTVANKQPFSLDTKISESNTGWDKYCWRCHQHDTNLFCSHCIRSYHTNCLKMKLLSPSEMEKWQCPECVEIKVAEKENKKKKFDVKHFNKLLKYAINRVLQDPNLQQFQFPVNKTQNPGYSDIIVNPVNLSKIENNIDNLVYTNSEAFLSDIKWILHNCSIYFSDNYKVTRAAKSLQKVSKQEVGDIETCPECYLNANTMTDNWFTETCNKPHLILWAKLKGFPYWPAKAMSINSTLVDVRFFGEHDRANIPAKDCYLYSREDPNPPTNKYKRNTIADCVKEVDIYVENIIAKYGTFNYANLKTPFNPQMAEQHLHDMIPGLRTARGRRRNSTARPDLTLKIVKTADNHLSVVKKDQTAKELPQIKRTVDITGDGAVSRTPTPPSAVLARRKTSDTRIKRSKSTNRHSEGKPSPLDNKSYQAFRRKSMAVEKLDQKRLNAIHSKLDLNLTRESSEIGFVRYDSKSTNEKHETELITTNVMAKKTNKAANKKRKLSMDAKATDATETPEKNLKLDGAATSSNEEKSEESSFIETNILSSVGLVKKTSTPCQPSNGKQTFSVRKRSANAPLQNTNSACDTEEDMEGSARTRSNIIQQIGGKDDSTPAVLMPFIEVKKEPETEKNAVNSGEQTPAASLTPICISSSNESTPAKTCPNTEEDLSNIKTETSSDDDSLMIIDDDFPNDTNSTAKSKPVIGQLLDNIRLRGSISVKDINKMTLQNQHQQARKSFPKGPTNSSASILKPRNNPVMNKPTPMNQTNMVCIPLDGLPRLDLTYNSTQPPPLSVVVSSNSVSLLTQNQSLSSVATNTSGTSTTTLSNGPPPLSIASIPVVCISQPSLLNSNSINTISNGMITEQLASAVNDQILRRNPPSLMARPAAPLRSTESDSIFPSEAGSLCKTLMENSHKMTDFFRSVIEDTLIDLANMSNPEAKMRLLELELEKQKNAHAKEMAEIRANTDRILNEMKKNMEKERTRVINDTRMQCELERIRSVDEAKKKQWCANCLKEAQFYCCWNTSYCNHICQRKHWEQHMSSCVQMETAQNVQNLRKVSAKTVSKPELRVPSQSVHHQKSQVSVQKDNLNAAAIRTAAARVANNSIIPGLRNILPKNSPTSMNQPRNINQQSIQPQGIPAPNQQSCIIVGRTLPNWPGATLKSHPNTIFLPTSQPYATITNVQSGTSAGVSLLNTSHVSGQKSNTTETIIIP